MSLYPLIESRLPADRSRPIIITPDGTEISCAALIDRAARMAAVLRANGVVPGDRVAARVEKSWDVIALVLACLRTGAVHLPLNTGYTASEIAYFLGDAEPRVFVFDPAAPGMAEEATKAGAVGLTLGVNGDGTLAEATDAAEPDPDIAERTDDDLAAILYTSGTTGRSKGAMLTHKNLASNALTLHEIWGFREGDVLLHALPLFHTHGLFVAANIMLLNGGTMILLPKFDADEILRLMPKATCMMGVPTFYTRLLDHPGLTREATKTMRLFVSGSAPLLAETHIAFEERTGHRILERYGMTETCMNTSNPLDGDRRAGTVGLPLPGVSVRVCDKDAQILPPGEVGVLEVKGPNVFKGYWRMPEKTAEEFRPDGFFITGDNAVIAEDGYVTIVGRDKDLIITGGFNVYPKEVEDVLATLPEVKESAVIGLPHPDFGEAVAAVIVPAPGATLDHKAIIAKAAESLAKFKVPKVIFETAELPRNTMGKVQKAAMRKDHAETFAAKAKASVS
jgi:malonyl-CoA/methylmalonyl-CoA synthetase